VLASVGTSTTRSRFEGRSPDVAAEAAARFRESRKRGVR
jgi:hypothetical protein